MIGDEEVALKPDFYAPARGLLFLLPPDIAHEAGMAIFRRGGIWRSLAPHLTCNLDALKTELCGVEVSSPVGLAAGYDKDGELLNGLMYLDFGFITVGSIIFRPRKGNPKPWIARIRDEEALVNALGLPSKGAHYVTGQLSRVRRFKPIVGSIAGFSIDEYSASLAAIQPFVDIVEINISSPTFKGSMESDFRLLEDLLERLGSQKQRPLLLKIPPYPDRESISRAVRLCEKHSIDGITASNVRAVRDARVGAKMGGLSGRPIYPDTRRVVKAIREESKAITVVAVGGVFTGRDVFELIGYGANAVGLLTSFIYRGPTAPRDIKLELAAELRIRSFRSVDDLRGYLIS